MRLTADTVRRLARLARVEVDEEEQERLTAELGQVLEYMERLREAEGRPDGLYAEEEGGPGTREDEPEGSVDREGVLEQAPDRDGPFFRVPPVLPPRRAGGEDEA